MADALDSKSSGSDTVSVRVRPAAPTKKHAPCGCVFLLTALRRFDREPAYTVQHSVTPRGRGSARSHGDELCACRKPRPAAPTKKHAPCGCVFLLTALRRFDREPAYTVQHSVTPRGRGSARSHGDELCACRKPRPAAPTKKHAPCGCVFLLTALRRFDREPAYTVQHSVTPRGRGSARSHGDELCACRKPRPAAPDCTKLNRFACLSGGGLQNTVPILQKPRP